MTLNLVYTLLSDHKPEYSEETIVKINEVETVLGIPKATIRFYEKERYSKQVSNAVERISGLCMNMLKVTVWSNVFLNIIQILVRKQLVNINIEDINEELISKNLYTKDIPDLYNYVICEKLTSGNVNMYESNDTYSLEKEKQNVVNTTNTERKL